MVGYSTEKVAFIIDRETLHMKDSGIGAKRYDPRIYMFYSPISLNYIKEKWLNKNNLPNGTSIISK